MRVQCSICTEHFDNASEISALPCGHAFHEECVGRWLHQSSTCPQCRERVQRSKVIKKLFFSEADIEEADGEDPSRLKNELDSAKLALKEKEKDKRSAMKAKVHTEQKMEELRESFSSMEALYKQERASNHSMQREVTFYKKMVKEAEVAKEEAKMLKKKFENLKAVETLIQGCESEAREVIHSNSDATQMATWCTVLRKELHTKRQEVKTLRELADRYKRELVVTRKTLAERTDELSTIREQAKCSEEALARAEGEISSLRKKMEALQRALGSPSDSAVSFAHRLINESPAPMRVTKRPRLSTPDDSCEIDLDVTPDLFPSPAPVKPSPSTHQKNQCQEYGTTFVKISTAAGKAPKPKRDLQDVSNIGGLNFNLFKKKNGFGLSQESSAIRKGYNGLGGHGKFLQPKGNGNTQVKKVVSTKTTIKTSRAFTGRIPALPSLDGFIQLD